MESSSSTLRVKFLSDKATLPKKGTPDSAGYDLASAEGPVIIPSGQRRLVKTDLSIACPVGTYGRIAPRSGLAVKHGIDVGAGVVDADYRGPVGIILFNFGDKDFTINAGDRIAQLILERIVCNADVALVTDLDDTERGEGGFGSTGVNDNDSNKKQRTESPAKDNKAESTTVDDEKKE
mmetsp:Transcript_38952/g.44453  ORF Transcript_38952/g.44453 Transcript_38952/m.44453 type:complete len:179 (+) Transcript_38952:273-809(+)|eukprot:CAMPEP_0194144654 /NCGR_PEP_ID=MMETSP0152-20130528/13687_1 /TAXON_ID=1049557 /ORGANISM="Thalassiothrix antarctica, Strain L6-D1" /LENGTH=178 /DNA_ID=CAMNT_0038844601 /DNA_START=283 /DNA_END=819 /DNA_ORIENTATION=+